MTATRQGTYISLDAAKVISTFMVNGVLDPDSFSELPAI